MGLTLFQDFIQIVFQIFKSFPFQTIYNLNHIRSKIEIKIKSLKGIVNYQFTA